MYGRIAILLATFLIIASLDFGNPGTPLTRILSLYHKADDLFRLPDSTPANDSTALAGFVQVIDEIGKSTGLGNTDTLLFQSWLKRGVLLDVKYDYNGAKEAYCRALDFHKQNDSLAFVAFVYTGTSYYNLNNFDSASYFLLKAESMADHFRDLEDQVRLYNTLGVLYYDNGNYQQGKNYFTRALEIVKNKTPFDTASAVSLQTNIATSFYHLGLFREALEIYHKILSYRIFADPIYMNMGLAYASLDKYREALSCFKKVDTRKVPGVLNEIGNALLQLHRPDSAALFLNRLQAPGNGFKLNDLDLGTNDLYKADLFAGRQLYMPALQSLQEAIIIFSRSFTKEDIFSNPSNFTGSFASYRLFDALLKKAILFERLYRTQPKEEYLLASYEAYKTTLSILRYIEKSYDTDDAKIFLKKKNAEVYQGALSICLELYHLHPERNYLEQAFLIGEKNKASIITTNLRQRSFNKSPDKEGDLLQRERNIKYNIARLNVRSEETSDRGVAEKIAGEKAGYEIELSRLQKELEQNGNYYKLKYDDSSPGLKELQRHLDDQQALISFYTTKEALHVFILTRSSFSYTHVDSLAALQQNVAEWSQLLKSTENGRKFKGASIGSRLYEQLIKPIQALIPQKEEWIIIPDGFLYFLPFESLPADAAGTTLLETTTISYQFSARLILSPANILATTASTGENPATPARGSTTVLAFAPFADKGATQPGHPRFNQLPASREELAGLQGKIYIDSQATKARFLAEINKYPIVHLATHAISSIDNASASFIAFYPATGSPIEDCLYLEELYGLNMNATKLVIISACETGEGELVSNEGVISLARAFAYAGCGSSVNSLWKADDKSTSFILGQFHAYLQKGYSKSKALRQAKLDYLKSDAINKSPAYWSHLVLMGNTEPLYPSGTGAPWKWGLLLILFVILILGYAQIRKRHFRDDIMI